MIGAIKSSKTSLLIVPLLSRGKALPELAFDSEAAHWLTEGSAFTGFSRLAAPGN
jgi:hypothetical protein